MPVHRVSGARPSYSWEPRLAGSGQTCLATWQSVPDGDTKCRPAAALRGGTAIENGIDRPEDSETWRVGCFTDDAGQAWIAWVTRIMYRSTKLYLRRISASGMSEACTIEIPMQKNFINTFDCQADRNVALAWEYSGSVFFIEFGIPSLRDEEGSPEVAGSAPPESLKVSLCPEPLAYTTEYGSEQLHVYFGDYHNHTSFSDGRAYPDISMLLGRDHRCLDFICITDHDVTLTPGEFAWNNTVADLLTENGTYVCLHGYEPSKGWAQHDFGHWNMLYPGDGQVFQFEEGMTPRDLNAYAAAHNAVLIPHHVGKKFAPYDWDYFDPDVERVVETCSIQGIFETYKGNEDQPDMVPGKFIQDGLARGYRFGLVAGSDYHNCFAALRDECGLTGVYVPALDAASIFEALKKRRTFALTGSRIVVDFRCNGKFMGEEVKGAEGLRFSCYAASPDIISAVRIVSDGVTVFEQTYDLPEVSFAWETEAPDHEAYYYLRAMTSKGDYAWSSPIWSVPAQ
jgi:hypothetical protein